MAFSLTKFLKGILITEENTLTPKQVEIIPGGSAGTKTTITSSQTSNQTLTLPNASDTLVGKNTTDTLTNKTLTTPTIDNPTLNGSGGLLTLPAGPDTMVGRATTDTLTNKTLTSPTIDTPTINGTGGALTLPAGPDTLVGKDTVDTLTNKTLTSPVIDTPTINGTGGTLALPVGPDTLVGRDTTDTLTNKSIDATTNTLSNIPSTATTLASETAVDISTSNTASTVNVGTGTGANTINIGGANSTVNFTGTVNNNNVTNLNVSDKLITINKGGGAASGGSSGFEIEEAGSPTGYFQVSSDRNNFEFKSPNQTGIITLPTSSASDTVVLKDKVAILTNKDIDGGTASNSNRLTLPKDTKANLDSLTRKEATLVYASDLNKVYADDGSVLQEIGSGGSGKNYIQGGDAETGVIFTSYANSSALPPVSTLSGTPTATVVASATNPLSGQKSFLFTPGSLGDGFAYDFNLDREDTVSILEATVNVEISGTFNDGDVSIFLIDTTAGQLLNVMPDNKIRNSTVINKQILRFQTQNVNSGVATRLCVHQASSSTSYTLKFEISLGPKQNSGYGVVNSDPVAYTPTFTSFGTVTGANVVYQRVGKNLIVHGSATAGTAAASPGYISLPAGLLIDTDAFTDTKLVGELQHSGDVTNTTVHQLVYYPSGGNDKLLVTRRYGPNSDTPFAPQNLNAIGPDGNFFSFKFQVPILGWSSSSISISDYDGRVVAAKYFIAGAVGSSSSQPVDFATKEIDTHNAVTTGSSWKFTAPYSGLYRISTSLALSSGAANLNIYKNGSPDAVICTPNSSAYDGGSAIIKLLAGDYIDLRLDASLTILSTPTQAISIEMLSGAQQITAGEKIFAEYKFSANAAVSGVVNFDQKVEDSHGAVTTGASWKFTAPRDDYYTVKTSYQGNAGAAMQVRLDGIYRTNLADVVASLCVSSSVTIKMRAGQYIDLFEASAGYTTQGAGNNNWVQISAGV